MKLSFSTLGYPEWSFEQIIKSARELGYEAVELRGVGNQLRMEEPECLRPENRGALKSLPEKNQIRLCGAGTPDLKDPSGVRPLRLPVQISSISGKKRDRSAGRRAR